MSAILLTDRLRLRQFTLSDVDNLLTLYGDPEVMRFLDSGRWDRVRVETETLPQLIAEYRRYARFGYWAAETHDGEFVGRIGLHPIALSNEPTELWSHASSDDTDAVSLGYRVRRSVWGRGYATELGRALVHRAFVEYGAREVLATTMAVNSGSRRVLEKIGFRHTRTVHLPWPDPLAGAEQGEVVYQLTR